MLRAFRTILITVAASAMLYACASVRIEPESPLGFDPHRNQVAILAIGGGETLRFLVDTAVTPSVIDLATAERLGFPIDRSGASEAGGVGSNRTTIYPSEIRGLRVHGRDVEPFAAAAMDMTLLSRRYGKPIHGVLGASFLDGQALLIDYPGRLIHFLSPGSSVDPLIRSCGRAFRTPLVRYRNSTAPLVRLDVAGATIPATLDTGGSGTVEFFEGALPPELAEASGSEREVRVTGARGDATEREFVLPAPLFLGPFRFEDAVVTVSGRPGTPDTRQANVGNRLLQDFRLLLDYRRNEIGLFADCSRAN